MLAYACNLGYAGMADASGISEDTLAWTSQRYLRQDTLREANARLVNAHHRHPLSQLCERRHPVVIGWAAFSTARS